MSTPPPPRAFDSERILVCFLAGIVASCIVTDRFLMWTLPGNLIDVVREDTQGSASESTVNAMSDKEVAGMLRDEMKQNGFLNRVSNAWPLYLIFTISGFQLGWWLAWFIGARPKGSSPYAWLKYLSTR